MIRLLARLTGHTLIPPGTEAAIIDGYAVAPIETHRKATQAGTPPMLVAKLRRVG